MTNEPERVPSSLPLGGFWIGSLLFLLSAVLASGSVLALTIAVLAPTSTIFSVSDALVAALAPLLMVLSVAYYRSARRHHYSTSMVSVIVMVFAVLVVAMLGSVLVSFGNPIIESRADPDLVNMAQSFAQSSLWIYVCILCVNISSSPFLVHAGRRGRAGRILFLGSAALFGVATAAPAISNLLLIG